MTPRLQTETAGVQAFPHSLRQLALQSLAVLVAATLALSSLGPLLDHHFAERHPGHSHLFFGTAGMVHSHDFQRSHDHHGSWMYGPVLGKGGIDRVAFLMPNDGIGYGSVDLTVPVVVPALFLRGDDDVGILGTPTDPYAMLSGQTVPPPERPPLV